MRAGTEPILRKPHIGWLDEKMAERLREGVQLKT